ncbi:MAG: hypothetical protein QM784_13130 [Polyangiaceae bacterium]
MPTEILDGRFVQGKDLRLAAVEAPIRVGKPHRTVIRVRRPGCFACLRGRCVQSRSSDDPLLGSIPGDVCPIGSASVDGTPQPTPSTSSSSRPARTAAPVVTTRCDERPGFLEAGRSSPHSFCYPLVSDDTVRIGPGTWTSSKRVSIPKIKLVVIQLGTTLRFADGASMIVHGRLYAEGTERHYIRFVPAASSGGLALQGPSTSGSRFAYVDVERGTRAERQVLRLPWDRCCSDSIVFPY